MTQKPRSEHDHLTDARARILAALPEHVVFDGWGQAALDAAIADSGVDPGLARLAFARGAVDVALAFHFAGDHELIRRMAAEDLSGLKYRDKVARAIELRLDIAATHKEAVRRAASFFALPHHAPDGARAIWHTADAIWTALGDTSRDFNWYSKRATLSAVWSACLLFWLGDDSPGHTATRDFIDRRIGEVMRFEQAKARFRGSALGQAWVRGPGRLLDGITAPTPRDDLPGHHGQEPR